LVSGLTGNSTERGPSLPRTVSREKENGFKERGPDGSMNSDNLYSLPLPPISL
jgi:hypothetical protein